MTVPQSGPTGEVGQIETLNSWSSLSAGEMAAPDPPALQWPQSVVTYTRMRNDPQVDSLCNSLTMPIMRFNWRLNPNGARDEVVERLSTDTGIPILGNNDPAPRSRRRFSHADHLNHALLALWYGFMFFEMVPDTERFDLAVDGWRLRKLAPRMPSTVQKIHIAKDGGLDGISQVGWRPTVRGRRGLSLLMDDVPQINVSALAAYVWKREGANWRGRSMLRPLYSPWLLKDRALRVDAMKNERFGIGIPKASAPAGADPVQYAKMAQAIRATEAAGVGLPAGGDIGIEGIRGTLPDIMASIKYYDEQMARSFMAMVQTLSQTSTGNRALGDTYADFFQMLVEAVANWYRDITNEHVVEDIVTWNWDEDEQAPRLEWSYSEDEETLAISDLVRMVETGAITMDYETEQAIRKRTRLPALPPLEEDNIQDAASSAFTQVGLPALVQSYILTPEEARQLLGVTGPAPTQPQVQEFVAARRPDLTTQQVHAAVSSAFSLARVHAASVTVRKGVRKAAPKITVATAAETRKFAARKQTLTDPVIGHRQPNAVELAAKTNFEEIQQQWQDATEDLVATWREEVQPAHIDALVEQVAAAVEAGDQTALVSLSAPVEGVDLLGARMLEMAEDAVVGAKAEALAQGVTIGTINTAEALEPVIAARAEATATLLSRSIAESAARKAIGLGTGALSPDEVAAAVREHLEGLTDAYLNDMLGGALTQAQNTGRRAVMVEKPSQIYASELLDGDTCTNCTAVDAREYKTIAEADADYPTGGFKDCLGGPRCRGTLVAVYDEAND